MKHAAPRPRVQARRPSRPVLAVLALLAAVLVLMGGQGTLAFWSDEATISTGPITSGRFDLTVDGQQGKDTAYVKTDLALDKMLPGESVARAITVQNAGDAPLTWKVGQVTTAGDLGPVLVVEMRRGAKVDNVTDQATSLRTGTCEGGADVSSGLTSPVLKPGATHALCVKVTLRKDAGNEFQGKSSGSVNFALNATQVTP